MKTTINRIIFFLSLLGILMAVYVLQSWLRHSSVLCLTGGGCESVRNSPASYPFGIPVPLFGLIGYTLLAICSFLQTFPLKRRIPHIISGIILGIAIFGVVFVSWFTYTELFVIRGVCMWCAISAVNMFVIFALAVKSYTLRHN